MIVVAAFCSVLCDVCKDITTTSTYIIMHGSILQDVQNQFDGATKTLKVKVLDRLHPDRPHFETRPTKKQIISKLWRRSPKVEN